MLLTNDEAALKLRSHGGEPKLWGFSGWMDCVRRSRYSASQEIALNMSTLPAYPLQSCPAGSDPARSAEKRRSAGPRARVSSTRSPANTRWM